MKRPQRGSFAVSVIAAASLGLLLTAAPAMADAPVASFSVSPASPLTLEQVTFKSTSTGSIDTYGWDLDGDGSFDDGHGPTAERSFASPGVYGIRLRVEGAEGSGEQARNVTIANRPPTGGLSWFPGAPVAGEPIDFVSGSRDPDGRVVDERWDLDGDGDFDDGTGPAVAWTFAEPGAHTVRLRSVDDRGAEAISEQALVVAEPVFPLITPFPVVRLIGSVTKNGTLVKRLVVSAPPGSIVDVLCSGPGCSRRSQRRMLAGAARTLRFHRFERRLRPRAALRIYVSKPKTVGKYTRFWFRRHRAPARTDLCLQAGTNRTIRC